MNWKDRNFLDTLARAIIAGPPSLEQIISRMNQAIGKGWDWIDPLARRYLQEFPARVRPRKRDVVYFLLKDQRFKKAWAKNYRKLTIENPVPEEYGMIPVPAAAAWDLPVIESVGDLARWLGISLGELQWLADVKNLERRKLLPCLRHYHYRILVKRSGRIRLIEAPKARLKEIQRKILIHILDRVPVHPSAHGFVKGRSIKTFAAPHVGRHVVLRLDLQDFFPTIIGMRVQAFFRMLAIPKALRICSAASAAMQPLATSGRRQLQVSR